jgi:chromosomal replication initiator protein
MGDNFPFGQFLNLSKAPDIAKFISKNDSKPDNFSSAELGAAEAEIIDFIKNNLSEDQYQAYFSTGFSLVSNQDQGLTFEVSTALVKRMIEEHYKGLLEKAAFHAFGKPLTIQLKSRSNTETKIAGPSVSQPNKIRSAAEHRFTLDFAPTKEDLLTKVESQYIDHIKPLQSGMMIDQAKTFDNFIVGASNQLAFATAMAVADAPGKSGKYPCLYIHSNSGLGKTHLLHAVANGIHKKFPDQAVCLITALEFMKEMINAIRDNKLPDFQKKYTESIDVLMIDDIHELKDRQGTQNEFFHVFNALHNKGKQLIFTSDKAPKEIDGIEERIKTRLQWGLVVDIQRPDLETRIAILKRKALELDLFLSDDIFSMIATYFKASIRELEGSLIKLQAAADIMRIEIEPEMVREMLQIKEIEEERKLTIEQIAKVSGQFFKIPMADLKSKSRDSSIVRARHIAMYLSNKLINSTLKEIAIFFGGRDHTSVMHGVRKIEEKLKTDSVLSKEINQIETLL